MEGRTDRFVPHKCPVCNGFGTLKYGEKICQACKGSGFVVIDNETGLPVDGKTEGKKDED
jgi:DnaJ-class molecular chaperone